jgi:hypothetical protein
MVSLERTPMPATKNLSHQSQYYGGYVHISPTLPSPTIRNFDISKSALTKKCPQKLQATKIVFYYYFWRQVLLRLVQQQEQQLWCSAFVAEQKLLPF